MKKVFLLILALLLFPLVSAKYINYSFIPYPNNFDYRDFMGENWMTPIRDQDGCGSCWAHAAVGAVEGVINLYYNQHLNVDLSEQQLVSCPGWGGNCLGGLYWMALGSMISNFVVDEECFSYQASNVPCDICENPEKTWLLSSLSSVYFVPQFYINWLKGKLFENGPGAMEVVSWNHAIVFAGFDENNKIIIKNSWGDDWGDNGYGVLEYDYYDMGFVFPVAPFSSPSTNVFCSDNDNDGYCYWGKNDLPKPKNCPQTCHTNSDIDFDDADEAIGPLRNVWIKNLQYDDTIKFGESGDITVVVALDGESDFFVEDVFVNFYLNDKLVESVSVSIGSNEMKTVVFSHFFDKLTNNYFKIEVDSIPQESQMFLDDNIVEGEMWVYNYDSGFVFSYKDNYTLFDCSTNENPSGMPIKGIIGPKLTTDSGILIYGKQDFQIKNCLIAGWSNGVNIHYSDSSLVSNNIIINNNKGIYLQSNSDENIVVDNELSNNIIGIGLQNSAHNNISSNVIYNTNYEGIELDRSSNNE
ncbi:MAG: right-handed parallel beta-helix repeat-containing protein, partial [Nanoarchaeota archaeon]|nr:right-handed parallel beta-helix repeat-containing protein [Nanoarchaeota archaeon]